MLSLCVKCFSCKLQTEGKKESTSLGGKCKFMTGAQSRKVVGESLKEEKFTLAPYGFHELFDGEWEVKTNPHLEFPREQGGDGGRRAGVKMLRKGREIEM